MIAIRTKPCSRCGNPYPATIEYFAADKKMSDGLCSACRACKRIYEREYYHLHKLDARGISDRAKFLEKKYSAVFSFFQSSNLNVDLITCEQADRFLKANGMEHFEKLGFEEEFFEDKPLFKYWNF